MKRYFIDGFLVLMFSAVLQTTCVYGETIEIRQKAVIEKGNPLTKINLKTSGEEKRSSKETKVPKKKKRRTPIFI